MVLHLLHVPHGLLKLALRKVLAERETAPAGVNVAPDTHHTARPVERPAWGDMNWDRDGGGGCQGSNVWPGLVWSGWFNCCLDAVARAGESPPVVRNELELLNIGLAPASIAVGREQSTPTSHVS